MAIDLGSTNTTRYHSSPDHADFTLPDGDWAWLMLCYPQNTANVKYLVSNGSFGGAGTTNIYCYNTATPTGFTAKISTLGEVYWTAGNATMDTWYWFYVTRRSGQLYVGAVPLSGSSASESAGLAITGSQDSSGAMAFGNRLDALTTRGWSGRWCQIAFSSGSGITEAQAISLANGTPLLSMPFAANIKFLAFGMTSSDATFNDLIGSKVVTRNGSSYGTNETDVQSPYAPSTGFGSVRVSGAWKTVSTIQVNVGGTWKSVSAAKVNVSGTWKSLA